MRVSFLCAATSLQPTKAMSRSHPGVNLPLHLDCALGMNLHLALLLLNVSLFKDERSMREEVGEGASWLWFL